jgi:hypothetical protein
MFKELSNLKDQINETIGDIDKMININKEVKEHLKYIESEITKNPENSSFELNKIRAIVKLYTETDKKYLSKEIDPFSLNQYLSEKDCSNNINLEILNYYFLIHIIYKYSLEYISKNPNDKKTIELESII